MKLRSLKVTEKEIQDRISFHNIFGGYSTDFSRKDIKAELVAEKKYINQLMIENNVEINRLEGVLTPNQSDKIHECIESLIAVSKSVSKPIGELLVYIYNAISMAPQFADDLTGVLNMISVIIWTQNHENPLNS